MIESDLGRKPRKKGGNEISCFSYNPLVPSVRSERTLRLWKIKTFSCKAKLSKSFDFLHNYSQYGDNWGNLNIIGLKWYLIPFLGVQKGQKMIFRPFLEVCKHKFGHNSVTIGRRDLRLLFLERQLNFASFAAVFLRSAFSQFVTKFAWFFIFGVSLRDFLLTQHFFCLIFFRGFDSREKWFNQRKD